MIKNPGRVIVHDESDTRLRKFWRLADRIDGTPYHYGVSSLPQLYDALDTHLAIHGRILELQLWGHASAKGFLINRQRVRLESIVESTTDGTSRGVRDYVWLRGCEFAESHEQMVEWRDAFGCAIVAHTKRISAEPWYLPWRQGGIVALREGEDPFWSLGDRYTAGPKRGQRLPGVRVTQMVPPSKATLDGTEVAR